ncbi:MAG: FAD-dependent oxidoreductase [Clostridiales bacterium]|nr:FAD-dependent oxidoreductase [Clostridiales bacterium]
MKTITEAQRDIPVAGESDLLVIGGGLAGVAAAVAAARSGVSVTLLEKSCVLGGLATLGHVCVYLPIDDGIGHKIHGGLAEELMHVCSRYSYNTIPDCWKSGPARVDPSSPRYSATFNIPACILAIDEFMRDEHVNVVFDTAFCMPIMDGNTCRGVIVENKSGRTAYLARMIIDSTGDSDVLYRAGADCELRKNVVSHWTYEIDMDYIRNGSTSNDVLQNIRMRWFGLRPDVDNSGSDIPMLYGTTSEDVNEYLRISRSLALEYLKKNQRDGYAMLTLPFIPQFRMTRRLKGLKEMDLTAGVNVNSSIGCVVHSLEAPGAVYEFPYEALIDGRITNIAAAGRMVSAGGYGWEIMRCIPNCVLTGQASGTAAALAIRAGCTLQEVDIPALQNSLADTGVMIHMYDELRNNGNLPPIKRKSISTAPGAIQNSLSKH